MVPFLIDKHISLIFPVCYGYYFVKLKARHQIISEGMGRYGHSNYPGHAEEDKSGSWAQISEPVERDETWKKIVTESEFQLGEVSVKGSWYDPKGNQDYYEAKYGTYPSIDGSTVAVPMAVEFARQHLGLSDQDAKSYVLFNTTHLAYENLICSKPNGYASIIHSTSTFNGCIILYDVKQ